MCPYKYTQSAVATNERQCFLKDPRTPTVNCSYYRTEGTNYTLQSLSPSTGELVIFLSCWPGSMKLTFSILFFQEVHYL